MKAKSGMWQYYAILSAVFAALTAIFAKVGVKDMDSDLATAIRTVVDASKVAPIDKLSVVFTIVLSYLVLREPVSWRVLLGGCLIAAGSIVILSGK